MRGYERKIVKVEVEKRVFIAEDGTEFQTAQECVDYENGCVARRADAIVAKLPHFTYSPVWIDPDYCWEWYFVSNEEELRAVEVAILSEETDTRGFTPEHYPTWVAISVDLEGYGDIVGTSEKILQKLDDIKAEIVAEIEGRGGGKL